MNMTFKNTSFKTVFAICSIFACSTLFTACGGDSSSSSNDDEIENAESSDSNGSSGSNDGSSGSIEEKEIHEGAITEARDIDLSKYKTGSTGKFVDERNGQTYNTVRTGIYTWILDNVNVKLPDLKSTCYKYDDTKCAKYGRLYMGYDNRDACPDGFNLPSVSEWRYFNEHEDAKLTYAGICSKRDTLECTGLDSAVSYLAYDDSAVVFDKKGNMKAVSATSSGFYSIRCVNTQTIVDSLSDLPKCEKESNFPYIYVIGEAASYYCDDEEWNQASSSYQARCSNYEEGSKYVFGDDLLFICKSGKWQLALMDDLDECTLNNINQEYTLNQYRFACTDSGWVRLSFPESELGLCIEKNYKKTAKATSKNITYVCDSTGWRVADVVDVYGVCESAIFNKTVSLDSTLYLCQSNHVWKKAGMTEQMLGAFCTAKIQDSLVLYNGNYYLCKNSLWQNAYVSNDIGICTSKRHGEKTVAQDKNEYYCNSNGVWQKTSVFKFSDNSIHICDEELMNTSITVKDTMYICDAKNSTEFYWRKADGIEAVLGFCPADTSFSLINDSLTFTCYYGKWDHYTTTISDYVGTCTRNTATVIDTVFKNKQYVCDSSTHKSDWFTPTDFDKKYGYCRTAILDSVVISVDSSTIYKCLADSSTTNNIRKWTTVAWYDNMPTCKASNLDKTAFNGINESACQGPFNTSYYYWRAIPSDTITDERTGYKYPVFAIGDQVWLGQDLVYFADESQYANITTTAAGNVTADDFTSQPDHLFYTWHSAMGLTADADSARSVEDTTVFYSDYQGACMEGWHIPTYAEWNTMFNLTAKRSGYTTNANNVAKMVDHNWTTTPGKADFGMNIDGFGHDSVYYDADEALYMAVSKAKGTTAQYWLPRETGVKTGSYIEINSTKTTFYSNAPKTNAYSIRCVKNKK